MLFFIFFLVSLSPACKCPFFYSVNIALCFRHVNYVRVDLKIYTDIYEYFAYRI